MIFETVPLRGRIDLYLIRVFFSPENHGAVSRQGAVLRAGGGVLCLDLGFQGLRQLAVRVVLKIEGDLRGGPVVRPHPAGLPPLRPLCRENGVLRDRNGRARLAEIPPVEHIPDRTLKLTRGKLIASGFIGRDEDALHHTISTVGIKGDVISVYIGIGLLAVSPGLVRIIRCGERGGRVAEPGACKQDRRAHDQAEEGFDFVIHTPSPLMVPSGGGKTSASIFHQSSVEASLSTSFWSISDSASSSHVTTRSSS